jgi:hypothetical protein
MSTPRKKALKGRKRGQNNQNCHNRFAASAFLYARDKRSGDRYSETEHETT